MINELQAANAATPKPIQVPQPAERPAPTRPGDVPPDEVLAAWIRRAKQLPEVRTDLIERIKAEIAAGTYETPEKIEAAIDRLLEDLYGI